MSAHLKPMPSTQPGVRTVPAGEFKAKCLKFMDEVAETQQPVTITKRGKAVAQLVPVTAETKPFRSIFGRSPSATVPDHKEWMQLKSEWAQEWEDSFERRARIFEQPKKRRK